MYSVGLFAQNDMKDIEECLMELKSTPVARKGLESGQIFFFFFTFSVSFCAFLVSSFAFFDVNRFSQSAWYVLVPETSECS